MSDKKLTEEEKEILDNSNLTERINKFKLYKEYVEPIHSKVFEYIKQICMLILVVNGTIIVTGITLNDPIYNDIILKSFISLILLFFYIMILFAINILIFDFLYSKKNERYIKRAYFKLLSVSIFTYAFIGIQIIALSFGFETIKHLFIN